MVYKLNGLLDKDIAIYKIYRVPMDKHARFRLFPVPINIISIKQRSVYLSILPGKLIPAGIFEAMGKACRVLFDYTDFTSFRNFLPTSETNNCIIYEAQWGEADKQLIFTVKAYRFCGMVRAIVRVR